MKKKAVSLKEWLAAITLLQFKKGHLSNGWLQLELQINSISLKKGWLQELVSKKHSTFENTKTLQVPF